MSSSKEQPKNDLERSVIAQAHRQGVEEYLFRTPLVLGVSGGADSLAMLHLLTKIRGESARETLHVAHLNHWFRGKEAQEDAEFVRAVAEKWGLSATIEVFDVPNYVRRHKLSTEDAARRVRYAFLASLAGERGAAVAVAHNADDQIETVLMCMLRGTGVSGLAGMQMLSTLPATQDNELPALFASTGAVGEMPLFRPLLHTWRHEIVAYCQSEKLEPRFDATNWERIYRRNRVRHDLIPLLQLQYSLAIKEHLFNLAEIARAEDELIESLVNEEWAQWAVVSPGGEEVRFESGVFALLPLAMRRRLVRRAVETVGGTLHDITFAHIEASIAVIADEQDSPTAIDLPHGLAVRREDGWCSVSLRDREALQLAVASVDWPLVEASFKVPIAEQDFLSLEGGWCFTAELLEREKAHKPSDLVSVFDYDKIVSLGMLELRTRLPGDFIHPLGMKGRRTLQDLMVDAKIPRELRERLPVVAFTGSQEVLWVPGPGGRRSVHALVGESTRRVLQLAFTRRGATEEL